jgi:hypothetical protein
MSIRELARTLYQLRNRLEQLERAVTAEGSGEKKASLERELFKTRADYDRARKSLEGAKEPQTYPRR